MTNSLTDNEKGQIRYHLSYLPLLYQEFPFRKICYVLIVNYSYGFYFHPFFMTTEHLINNSF